VIREAVEAAFAKCGETAAGEGARSTGALAELLTRITGRPAQDFSLGANLESGLGLSSLERVELLGALEDRFQIDLSETKFADAADSWRSGKIVCGVRRSMVVSSMVVGKTGRRPKTVVGKTGRRQADRWRG
jgi:acyl carrier protein